MKLHAVTDKKPTAQTDSTDGFVIYTDHDAILSCRISVKWNGQHSIRTYGFPVSELEYVQGFVSPAVEVGRYRDENECIACLHADIDTECQEAVYLRAYQKNGDGVFTSPVNQQKGDRRQPFLSFSDGRKLLYPPYVTLLF